MTGKDIFVAIKETDYHSLKNEKNTVHLASNFNSCQGNKNITHFVPLKFYEDITSVPVPKNKPIYLAVSFPESQLFMDHHQGEIYLINDEAGIEKYGHAAYFVEEGLYKRVMESLVVFD